MAKKVRHDRHAGTTSQLATKRDIRELARKTEAGFEQLIVTSAAALKLTQREIRDLRRRLARLERRIGRRR